MAFWHKLLKPHAWVVKLLMLFSAPVFLALGYLGYLDQTQALLDSELLSFRVGEARFSVYVIIRSALIFVFLLWFTGLLSDFLERRITLIPGIRAADRAIVTKTLQLILYFIAFVFALNILGLDLTAFALFSGALGIGIGFGLQKITSNFISGLILIFEKSIRGGDLVELSDGIYGTIKHTGARHTLIETFDGKEIMIPNEDFISNRVTNWTYSHNKARIDIRVGVAYGSPFERAMEVILDAAKIHPRCLKDPEPVCYLYEFGDNSVNFLLFFWVDDITEGLYQAKSEVMLTILNQFKANDISIPFPQRDLYIKNPDDLK